MDSRRNIVGWEIEQLVKCGLFPDEQAAIRGALRALVQLSPKPESRWW